MLWLKADKSIADIHKELEVLGLHKSLSTVSRYIQKNCLHPQICHLSEKPGETAYISLLKVPKAKEGTYLFCCLLRFSRYNYFSILRTYSMQAFLDCNAKCFATIGGVPKCILLCRSSCLSLTQENVEDYNKFLVYHNCCLHQLPNGSPEKEICISHTEQVTKNITAGFFHIDLKKLLHSLKHKHADAFNLSMHPDIDKPICKVFEETEKNKLQPLPEISYPVPCERKVSVRGIVSYKGKHYQLPKKYSGTLLKLSYSNGTLIFEVEAEQVASFPYKL